MPSIFSAFSAGLRNLRMVSPFLKLFTVSVNNVCLKQKTVNGDARVANRSTQLCRLYTCAIARSERTPNGTGARFLIRAGKCAESRWATEWHAITLAHSCAIPGLVQFALLKPSAPVRAANRRRLSNAGRLLHCSAAMSAGRCFPAVCTHAKIFATWALVRLARLR